MPRLAAVFTALLFIAAGARSYYLSRLYVLLFAAGSVGLQPRLQAGCRPRRWRWPISPSVFVVSGVLSFLSALPVGPPSNWVPADFITTSQVGWTELAASVADRRQRLPKNDREQVVLLAANYWHASALEYYGPPYGLPAVFSGHRGYGFFGVPAERTPVLLIGTFDAPKVCAVHEPLNLTAGPSRTRSNR